MTKFLRFNQLLFPALFSLLLFMLPVVLSAQEAPVSVSFTPPDGWEEGDEVEMIIDYGSEDYELKNLIEVAFQIEMPEGTSISTSSDLEVYADNSWFAFDNNWTGSAEVANDGSVVNVSLVRTNGTPASGYGEVARVKGLVVEIGEIMMKNGYQSSGEVLFDRKSTPFSLSTTYNGSSLKVDGAPVGSMFTVVDFSGRVLAQQSNSNEISLPSTTRQLVVLYVKDQNGNATHKLLQL